MTIKTTITVFDTRSTDRTKLHNCIMERSLQNQNQAPLLHLWKVNICLATTLPKELITL